jgi:hypothetical protein
MLEFLLSPMAVLVQVCSALGDIGVVLFLVFNLILASILWPYIFNSWLHMLKQHAIVNWGHGLALGLCLSLDDIMIQVAFFTLIVVFIVNFVNSFKKT